jgi:membrane protease YdiL (CAAX protease family)
MSWLRRHPIACFLTVTYTVTWGAWLSLAAAGRTVGPGFEPLYLLGLLGPLIGAVVTSSLHAGGLHELMLRITRIPRTRWWLVALGLPLAIGAVTLAGALLIATFGIGFATERDFGAFTGFPLTSPVVLWLLLVVVDGFGEETGWRGFLQSQLQRRRSPILASLLVGGAWALWHWPAFLICDTYRALPIAVLPVFFIGILAGSVFLAWLYDRSGGSILVVAVWHGTYNLLSGSAGARGALAAIETAFVIVLAVVLVTARRVPGSRRGAPASRRPTPAAHA